MIAILQELDRFKYACFVGDPLDAAGEIRDLVELVVANCDWFTQMDDDARVHIREALGETGREDKVGGLLDRLDFAGVMAGHPEWATALGGLQRIFEERSAHLNSVCRHAS
jgi:hypothetical protein